MSGAPRIDGPLLPRVVMQPHETCRFKVRAEQLTATITPNDDIFVLAHFGIPRIAVEDWRLHISGMVARPAALSLADLKRFAKVEIESFIKCAGLPHDPTVNTRSVSNAVWGGADLAQVLDAAGLDPAATFLWATGPDHGSYARWSADRYRKDVPLDRVRRGGVLLAYEVNGEPLPVTHGFPLRLFIPGYYGANCVKWLCQLHAAMERAPGIFTRELYNDPVPGDAGRTMPVWQVPPEALIVSPADRATLGKGRIDISGWCWGAVEIAAVDVSLDGGDSWAPAATERRRQWAWQKFSAIGQLTAGTHRIMVRARDANGEAQPLHPARNAVHSISVTTA
jgi:DMSO/TMAO reductase YedYZ molybdopterin-dependent catalytic subunit